MVIMAVRVGRWRRRTERLRVEAVRGGGGEVGGRSLVGGWMELEEEWLAWWVSPFGWWIVVIVEFCDGGIGRAEPVVAVGGVIV